MLELNEKSFLTINQQCQIGEIVQEKVNKDWKEFGWPGDPPKISNAVVRYVFLALIKVGWSHAED